MSNNLICFGDVVKLSAKSAFVDGDGDGHFLGFLEHKKDLLLVVAPVKPELADKFLEAEFIVSPVRSDKPPTTGTPLNYKQPFVLKTSDGSGYALNNKTPSASEVVSLRESSVNGVKGEMYVAIEKEGFGPETHVHDGDTKVELHVVDSNRIRKTYNNVPLRHFQKFKSDAPGGHVTCSSKGHVLSLKLVKVADKFETRKFIKDPVFRRASQLLVDAKADETSEASVLDSPSRAGSITTAGPLVSEDPIASVPASPTGGGEDVKVETPETEATVHPEVSAAGETPTENTPETTATTTTATATGSMETTTTSGVCAAELTAQLEHVAVVEDAKTGHHETHERHDEKQEETPAAAGEQLHSTLATIELSAASVSETDALDGAVPVHDKLSHTHASLATEQSELDTLSGLPTVHEEHVETACAGKCTIM